MENLGLKNPKASLTDLGFTNLKVHWNLTPSELIEKTIQLKQGVLTDTGALAVDTGEFTGRSPKDRYIVKDSITANRVDWGNVNIPIDATYFDRLYNKITAHLSNSEIYARDAFACSHPDYRMKVRVINEFPWQNMFAYNMFIRPTEEEIKQFEPDWHVIAAPSMMAIPAEDGTRQHNFAIINFSKKAIIIGGTAYTGEIKKGIFSVLNFLLPVEHQTLSMHCSSNVGREGDTAIFFGLSGTGKTTLSTDKDRKLIGDDEHGWSGDSVFNFEGGCYAKCIDLDAEKEPQIYNAIKYGSLIENINFFEGTRTVDFENIEKTQNTRVSYPIHHIDNIMESQIGGKPKNIFFLTCDAFGVLPPISRLSVGQAMYHFISGYTAKVAGTEEGVTEPQTTFSACFGAPFLPLHPTEYAVMLGEKLKTDNTRVWLINTGWSGGSYGVGRRMKLSLTRAMIKAALDGTLDAIDFQEEAIFGLSIPTKCPEVPTELLNPRNTWKDKDDYDRVAGNLAQQFIDNFGQYQAQANAETMAAAPKVMVG